MTRDRLWHDPALMVAVGVILVAVVVALAAPLIAPYDPLQTNMADKMQAPNARHWLGTDQLGRDNLSRIIWGTRISMVVGVLAVSVAVVLGVTAGVAAGYLGGPVDAAIVWVTDSLLSFPLVLMAILLIAFFGSTLLNILLAVGISLSPRFARVARASTLTVKPMEYVQAARAVGGSDLRICLKHVLPNILPSLLVVATMYVSSAILIEANLSYLGMGVRPPTPTWGSIINEGGKVLREAPWLALCAGTAIMVVVLAFNVIGDALRDFLDPRLR